VQQLQETAMVEDPGRIARAFRETASAPCWVRLWLPRREGGDAQAPVASKCSLPSGRCPESAVPRELEDVSCGYLLRHFVLIGLPEICQPCTLSETFPLRATTPQPWILGVDCALAVQTLQSPALDIL